MSGRAQGRPKKRGSGSSTASGTVPRAGSVCSAVGAQEDGAMRPAFAQKHTPIRMASIFSNRGARANVDRHSEAVMEMMAEVGSQELITSQTSVTATASTPSSSSSSQRTLHSVALNQNKHSDDDDDDISLPLTPDTENDLMGALPENVMMVARDVAPRAEDCYDEDEGPGLICVEEVEEVVGSGGDDVSIDEEEHSPYVPDVSSEGSSEEDESRQHGHRLMLGMGRSRSGHGRQKPSASASTTVRSNTSTTTGTTMQLAETRGIADAPSSKQKGKFTSPIWNYFHVSPKDESYAVCNTCQKVLSRGRNPAKMGTSSLQTHLYTTHKNQHHVFKMLQKQKGCGRGTMQHSGGAAAAAASRPHGNRQGQTINRSSSLSSASSAAHGTDSEASQCSFFSSPSQATAHSSAGFRQTLLSENFVRTTSKPLPPKNWRIRKLNGLLAQAMCSQLLPYSLINKGSAMRALLQFGIPEWEIPSRHYFSRTAIPALHAFVVGNVARSLDHSVGERVHITMDSWSSRFGTGRYLSVTAHWVTLVEVGENPSAAAAAAAGQLVVPPRGMKGDVAGSSNVIPSTPGCKQARLSTNIKPQQCQALLKLVSLGKEKLTGEYILETLRKQEEIWLTPRGLKVGNVASDNGSNLLAALRLGHLEHIPCLAHVLNLVVQRFLRTYPGMEQLLETVRKVVRHVRRSATAAATLAELQQDEGLPSHRLIIDVPTRWNSTHAMLQRLLQHREAVDKYIYEFNYRRIHRTQTSASNRLPVISADQWAQIQQVCLVLVPFLQGTKMVSRNCASVCEWVPLVCMLDRAVCNLLEAGEEAVSHLEVDQLQQEEEEEDSDLQAVGEELEVPNLENEVEQQSAASVVRGWRLHEDIAQEEEVNNNIILETDDPIFEERARLFPLAAHMLRCLRRDPRVRDMQEREEIWISLVLDPRLKGKLGEFMSPSTAARRTKELQESLVRRLQEAFPLPSTAPTVAVPSQQQQVPAFNTTSSSTRRLGDLLSLTKSLYTVELPTVPRAEVPAATESSFNQVQQQRFSRMVSDYMGSFSGLGSDSPVEPMEYWVRRLSLWKELAQYALEVLACPPSSVLSERCFSAAGGVVTEKRSGLSADSVDKLTFLKINQSWMEGEFMAPIVGDRRK